MSCGRKAVHLFLPRSTGTGGQFSIHSSAVCLYSHLCLLTAYLSCLLLSSRLPATRPPLPLFRCPPSITHTCALLFFFFSPWTPAPLCSLCRHSLCVAFLQCHALPCSRYSSVAILLAMPHTGCSVLFFLCAMMPVSLTGHYITCSCVGDRRGRRWELERKYLYYNDAPPLAAADAVWRAHCAVSARQTWQALHCRALMGDSYRLIPLNVDHTCLSPSHTLSSLLERTI